MQSVLSSLKNLRSDISRRLPGYISRCQSIYRIVMLATRKHSLLHKKSYATMSGFTSILILDQMILRLFSIRLDFWYPRVTVAIFFLTISLWLLADSTAKMKD